MREYNPLGPALSFVGTLLLCFSAPAVSSAETLQGRLEDSLSGTPIADADVRVLGTNRRTTTDEEGRWRFELPPGEYQLAFDKTIGHRHFHFRLVRQRVPQYKSADAAIPTTHYVDRGARRKKRPQGAPSPRLAHPSNRDRGPVDLSELFGDAAFHPGAHTLPDNPPRTIRVGRRSEKDNCSNPITAIEEMPLEEYVRGVLPPEIGVFRNLSNVEEVYEAFALAAKSYGLYFMLVYDSNNRRTVSSPKPPNNYTWFHIDDTPCNQRYSDKRLSITTNAADRKKGEILVKDGAPNTLDKFEYAASCGEHGTRPAYQQAIVDDSSPAHSCVNSWCGHDSCAGHADHPNVSGSDRCLVRGFCQWGAAEWAEGGKDDQWLIQHYQPNLRVRKVWNQAGEEKVDVQGYVYTDPDDIAGSAIPDAQVRLDGGEKTTTNSDGLYSFSDINLSRGSVTVSASKPGYESNQRTKMLQKGMDNWASIRLRSEGTGDAEPTTADTAEEEAAESRDVGSDTTGVADPRPRRFGGLGPPVGRSGPGQSESCSCASPRSGSLPPLAWMMIAVALGAGSRFRRR